MLMQLSKSISLVEGVSRWKILLFLNLSPPDDPLLPTVYNSAEHLTSGIVYRLEHLVDKEERVRSAVGCETLAQHARAVDV
jgi:hypothetical protein